jgi:hypothetical protein
MRENTMKCLGVLVVLAVTTSFAFCDEYHVSDQGDDAAAGTASRPLRTIQAAANKARPGDVITVHEGTYRERVNPPRGGTSDTQRIVYQAAPGEKVELKGSEIIKEWKPLAKGVWTVEIPDSFFGEYNPYVDLIHGDWFDGQGRVHHTGEVYLNGRSLYEMASVDDLTKPDAITGAKDPEGAKYRWYCKHEEQTTRLWANFQEYNPNEALVEINVREACFYPDQPGRNFITIRGFHMSQAATQWAAPTAEQPGLIGTHWSKGWIIENNVVSNSRCTGITLGKDRKSGHNVWSNDPSKGGAEHYNEVIVRVLEDGWGKARIGSHIVRNNTIFACEQAGICGSMAAAFSQVTNNHIYDVWTKRLFRGAEIAGIKFHGAIDTLIKNNHIHNVGRGMWMDWMTQGTRLTANLCYDNDQEDLFSEVNHGPYLVDNNIFLSPRGIMTWSEGGAYAHNLIAGKMVTRQVKERSTPYHKAHSTALAGVTNIAGGDERYYNNIFVAGYANKPADGRNQGYGNTSYGLAVFDSAELPMFIDGNVYLNGAKPSACDVHFVELPDLNPQMKIVEQDGHVLLHLTLSDSCQGKHTKLVTTQLLGRAKIPNLPYDNPDGSPITVDTDYFGKKRNPAAPSAGPFEQPGSGALTLEIWPP